MLTRGGCAAWSRCLLSIINYYFRVTRHEDLSRLLMGRSYQSGLTSTSFRCVCLGGFSCLQTSLLSGSSLGRESQISGNRNWKVKWRLRYITATCLTCCIGRVATSCCQYWSVTWLTRLDWGSSVSTYTIGSFHEWRQGLLWVLLIQDGRTSNHRSGLRWTSSAAWLAFPILTSLATTIKLSLLSRCRWSYCCEASFRAIKSGWVACRVKLINSILVQSSLLLLHWVRSETSWVRTGATWIPWFRCRLLVVTELLLLILLIASSCVTHSTLSLIRVSFPSIAVRSLLRLLTYVATRVTWWICRWDCCTLQKRVWIGICMVAIGWSITTLGTIFVSLSWRDTASMILFIMLIWALTVLLCKVL